MTIRLFMFMALRCQSQRNLAFPSGMTLLEQTHLRLEWPSPAEIMSPTGAGIRVQVEVAQRKLEPTISRLEDGLAVKVGLLSRDPNARVTETPIAVVCEFSRPVNDSTLHEVHRLAWNFCHAPLLITLEPHLIRSWTCCEPPVEPDDPNLLRAEIEDSRIDVSQEISLSDQAAQSLHWIELATGNYIEQRKDRFKRDQCADRFLLENLRVVRRELLEKELPDDVCHDLLARLIFIQFLVDRKDSSGNAALSIKRLDSLFREGILSQRYESLGKILQNYEDSYALFKWLNDKFNGDLFPGSGKSPAEREEAWVSEQEIVSPEHLRTLANFLSGNLDLSSRQRLLWREYRFDVIPLEFISSIYEEFVTQKRTESTKGTVYTRPYLVDFVLDEILPWDSNIWDVKILDPACGSGIFLVKAYQRLVYRWKRANAGEPRTADLRRLLEENLLGVDKDHHAVRVASFSLYLAMCDEIDPRYYWTKVKFPPLREYRLLCADFFSENTPGIRTEQDAGSYDIVLGNAPWGRDTVNDSDIDRWKRDGWEPTYNNIGPLFIPKAAKLCKSDGMVSLLEPVGILTNDAGTAERFRRKLFQTYQVCEVVNLSALRFVLFATAIGPACIITFRPTPPDGNEFAYLCPKELHTSDDDFRIIIEPQDVHFVHPSDAVNWPTIWTALMWGGPRDAALIRRLESRETLNKLLADSSLKKRQGLNRGKTRQRKDAEILDRPILKSEAFPEGTFHHLDVSALPLNEDPNVDHRASRDYAAFTLPQILIKQGWQQEMGRFRAAIAKWKDAENRGALCSKSYVSVHVPKERERLLDAVWLAFNSCFAVYYLFLTSSRFASYRPEANVGDLMDVPLPREENVRLSGLKNWLDVDKRARDAYGFRESEWLLIEDLCSYTLPDFKDGVMSLGRFRTDSPPFLDDFLIDFCDHFSKVLRAAFGESKSIAATVFSSKDSLELPVRLVAFHLGAHWLNPIRIEEQASERLRSKLLKISKLVQGQPGDRGSGVFFRRVCRVYDSITISGKKVPTVYLIKPNQRRYWTRSMAIRDADEVALDIMKWQDPRQEKPSKRGQ